MMTKVGGGTGACAPSLGHGQDILSKRRANLLIPPLEILDLGVRVSSTAEMMAPGAASRVHIKPADNNA